VVFHDSLLIGSVVHAIIFLSTGNLKSDTRSAEQAFVGVVFGMVGIVTGMIWAKNTWGAYWTNDPKLNSAAIGMLMYMAYMVLRSSIEDEEKRARVSAVYNIFSLPAFLVLIFVLPRLTASLHPGNGGNPGFSSYDLDSRLRAVFYPAIIGFTLMGYWMAQLGIRTKLLEHKRTEEEHGK
jgi:heme exporter protein C